MRWRAKLARHHVDAQVHELRDLAVALANARGLDENQVKARGLGDLDGFIQGLADFAAAVTCSQRAHIHALGIQRVHADAVAQQGAARFLLGGVHTEHRYLALRKVGEVAAQDLIAQRTFARAARPGHANHGRLPDLGALAHTLGHLSGFLAISLAVLLGVGNQARHHQLLVWGERVHLTIDVLDGGVIALAHHEFNHAVKTHLPAVFRAENAVDAIGVQFGDFLGHDYATAPAVNPDARGALLPEQILHVLEELDVPALVTRDGNALGVFLDRGIHDLFGAAVVAEMNHLCAVRLQQAPHDVDGSVMAVKQRRCGDKADFVARFVKRLAHGTCAVQQFNLRAGARAPDAGKVASIAGG